jgi:hypothetical protein
VCSNIISCILLLNKFPGVLSDYSLVKWLENAGAVLGKKYKFHILSITWVTYSLSSLGTHYGV